MIYYEFGGDDYHDGEEFEYDPEPGEEIEALASYMVDDYVHHLLHSQNKAVLKMSSEQIDMVRKAKKNLQACLEYILYSYDLVTDDLKDDMADQIKDYLEDRAQEQWNNSRD